MSREINFIGSRRSKLTKSQELDFKILRLTGIVFGALLLVFFITLIVTFFLTRQISDLKEQQKNLERQVLGQEEVEKKILITSEKLKNLADLFGSRYDKQAAIDFFSNIFGSEVLIKDINYEADEKILSLRIQCRSIFILEQIFDQLAKPEVEKEFGLVNKSELTRNDSGSYNMAITISLEDKTAPAKATPPKK